MTSAVKNSTEEIVYITDENFDNVTTVLRVVVDNFFPYIFVHEHNSTITGYMRELWRIMEQTLHFKSKFMKTPFTKGKKLLVDGLVDVILIPIVVTTSDVDEFDYSVPVAKNWYELYSKRNGNGATWASYIETWSPSLWIAFLLTIFSLSVAFYIIIRMGMKIGLEKWGMRYSNDPNSQAKTKELKNATIKENSDSFVFCFLTVLGIITNQGYNINAKTASLRIITLVVLFFGLLMLNSYSAVLVSRLAVDKADILFPTLESVADRNKYALCVREISYAYRMFKQNEGDLDLIPIWRSVVNKAPCENVSSVKDIERALCDDYTAVLESPHVVASILESRKCVVTRMPGRYATSYTSLLMRKNLQFKRNINQILQKLLTSGIIDFLQKKWLSRRMPYTIRLSNNKPVTINHINGILVVYGAAIIFSLIILFVEKFMRWGQSKTKMKLVFVN